MPFRQPRTQDSPMSNSEDPHPQAAAGRSTGPKISREIRKRARFRAEKKEETQSASQTGGRQMKDIDPSGVKEEQLQSSPDVHVERKSLCLPNFDRDIVVQAGEEGYKEVLQKHFPSAESNATERLVDLKTRLKTASTFDFWDILMREMCSIVGAQCGFVAKRILVDEENRAVEMPAFGEEGSCLMGVAFYINNGKDVNELHREYEYKAYDSPCAHMKHDKTFIIPERLSEVIPRSPNKLPWERSEAFIGVPLFADGKCFAHFGMVWSSEGKSRLKLGWTYIEMFMHSLEDMILERILEGKGFAKDSSKQEDASSTIIPLSEITPYQTLKSSTRNLAHEFRTPMQGIVGMLDLIKSSVEDEMETQSDQRLRNLFGHLQSCISSIEGDTDRATKAVEDVVYAYESECQMPALPPTPDELSSLVNSPGRESSSTSRKRAHPESVAYDAGPLAKRFATEAEILGIYCSDALAADEGADPMMNPTTPAPAQNANTSKQHPVTTRELLRAVLVDIVRKFHPTQEEVAETDLGIEIGFETRDARGEILKCLQVKLEVALDVPEVIITTDPNNDLRSALVRVVENAFKFTNTGKITVQATIDSGSGFFEISVEDTGNGIAEEFKAEVFQAGSQQDSSTTRQAAGNGLGLFVAKSKVRAILSGDLSLVRSETAGPCRGSVFKFRLPILTRNTDTPVVGIPSPEADLYSPRSAHSSPTIDPESSAIATAPVSQDSDGSIRRSVRRRFNERATRGDKATARDYPLNILIVEDTDTCLRVGEKWVQKLGYSSNQITLAENGQEAIDLYVRALEEPSMKSFDLVLMDYEMPILDGYGAAKQIHQTAKERGKEVIVVATTADPQKLLRNDVDISVFQDIIKKPWGAGEVEGVIKEHFAKREKDQ